MGFAYTRKGAFTRREQLGCGRPAGLLVTAILAAGRRDFRHRPLAYAPRWQLRLRGLQVYALRRELRLRGLQVSARHQIPQHGDPGGQHRGDTHAKAGLARLVMRNAHAQIPS